MDDKYKTHKVKINNLTYMCKYDKLTNKPMYKRKFSVSIEGHKKINSCTKIWQTSTNKADKEVEALKVEIRNKILKGIPLKRKTNSEKHLYEEVVKEFHQMEISNRLKQNRSFEVMDKYLSNNLKYVVNSNYPNFKNKYIEDLTIYDIKQLKNDINAVAVKRGLSVLTIGSVFTNIDCTLKYAHEKGYIDNSIVDNVRVEPRGKRRAKKNLTNILLKEEFDELMEVFKSDFKFTKEKTELETQYRKQLYYTYLQCAFLLGFRKGEGFSLKWSSISEDKIYIDSTLNTKNVKKYTQNKTYRVIDPKTKNSIREMKIPKSIRIILDEWKSYLKLIGREVNDNDFIFLEYNKQPLKPTTFAKRFETIVKQSQIQQVYNKQISIHSFRHSCCSYLVEQLRRSDDNISLREIEIAVGRYLGHGEDGNMVREVYMHLYPEKEDSIMNKMLDNI